jgi:DNA-binding transcriptional ArsR family regulator
MVLTAIYIVKYQYHDRQPTISHHLKVLRESGWVTSERRGSNVWYRLRPDAVARFNGLATGLAPVGRPDQGRVLPVVSRSPEARWDLS